MIVVSVITDNVIEHQFSFIDTLTAEKVFTELVEHYDDRGLSPGELEDCLDDGYFDASGCTICISWPDTDFNNDFLMSIREGK